MNTGMASDIPVQLFLLNPFFNVFNRWQLPLQFFRQAVGYFIRTDAHGLGHILECIFRHQVIFALTQQQANRGMIIHGICASAACTISKFGKRSANFAIYLRFRTEYPFASGNASLMSVARFSINLFPQVLCSLMADPMS